jgi:hypothetical protein
MFEKELRSYAFVIEVSPNEKENFARFWFECFRLAITRFPSLSFKMFQDVDFAVCPKVDIARVSNPE